MIDASRQDDMLFNDITTNPPVGADTAVNNVLCRNYGDISATSTAALRCTPTRLLSKEATKKLHKPVLSFNAFAVILDKVFHNLMDTPSTPKAAAVAASMA